MELWGWCRTLAFSITKANHARPPAPAPAPVYHGYSDSYYHLA